MDSLRLDTLGGHVVAWHNGHRLARRITVVHVSSLGYVVLPFASAQASTAAALPPAAAQTPESGTPTPAPPARGLAPAVAVALALAPGTDEAEAPSDEPIEVLIDAPDLDLRTVTGAPSDDPGAQSLAEAAALAEPDRPAEAPLDIVFDAPTTEPTAGAGADAGAVVDVDVDADADADSEAGTGAAPDSPPPEAQSASDPTAATHPEAAAGPTAGATLRERAMARAHQMAQEAAAKAPPPDRAPADPAPPSPAPPAVAALAADMLAAPPAAAPEQNPAAPANAPLAAAPPAAAATASPANDLRPIFSEDFIPPHKLADVAAFALLHGAVYASPGKDGLVRVVKPDPALAVPVVEQRWLLTAQIDIGGQRTRVLVGAGSNPAVMGLPLSQLPRLALLGGPPLAVVAAAGLWWLWPAAPKAPKLPVAATQAATQAASAASAASAAAPIAAAASAAAPADAASAVQASASAPADVAPTLGRVDLPSLGPVVDERRRAAAAAAEARAASAATVAIEQVKKAVPPPPVVGPAFAVSTRLLRTRTESEQLADAMRELLAGSGPPGLQVQALRSGEDWRVVVWPFTEQAQAERARVLLASRGMKVAVIDF